jgi:starch-binding outer membrane protein, SusD/RagB family
MKNKFFKNTLILGSLAFVTGCSKLDEKYNSTAANGVGITAAQLLRGAYNGMQDAFTSQDRFISLSEHSTDEMCGPTRAGDWDDNGVWRVIHTQNLNADHGQVNATFDNLLILQYNAANVLNFNPTVNEAAQARFIRAFAVWAVLDGWNQVPYRTIGSSLSEAPMVLKGAAACDTLINELNAIIPNLTDGVANRANKNAARALLMKIYLNKAVYAGDRKNITFNNTDLQQVVTIGNQITGYSLATNYFDNFGPANASTSTENIYTYGGGVAENQGRSGNNIRSRWHMTMHYNQNPSGWNGFTTLADFYDKFDATDTRRGVAYPTNATSGMSNPGNRVNVGFLIGQQYDLTTDAALNDRNGHPLAFTRNVSLTETDPATLEFTGIRCVKWSPDYTNDDQPANEFAFFRYADILLMQAEAMLRNGDAPGALLIVNNIHTKRGAPALASIDLAGMLDERGREMYWEGWRRNDMIRFGTFLNANALKPVTAAKCLLFPIPNNDLAANPNLSQNPGY